MAWTVVPAKDNGDEITGTTGGALDEIKSVTDEITARWPPVSVSAAGTSQSGIAGTLVTVCTLSLASQSVAGEWHIEGQHIFRVNTTGSGDTFDYSIFDGGTTLSSEAFDASDGFFHVARGSAYLTVAASTAKTITAKAQRTTGSTSTLDATDVNAYQSRLQAKFYPTAP